MSNAMKKCVFLVAAIASQPTVASGPADLLTIEQSESEEQHLRIDYPTIAHAGAVRGWKSLSISNFPVARILFGVPNPAEDGEPESTEDGQPASLDYLQIEVEFDKDSSGWECLFSSLASMAGVRAHENGRSATLIVKIGMTPSDTYNPQLMVTKFADAILESLTFPECDGLYGEFVDPLRCALKDILALSSEDPAAGPLPVPLSEYLRLREVYMNLQRELASTKVQRDRYERMCRAFIKTYCSDSEN